LRLAKGLLLALGARALGLRLLKSIAAVAAYLVSICFSFSFALSSLFIVFKLQRTMSLPLDLRNFICFLRQRAQERLCLARKSVALRSFSRRASLALRNYYLPTRTPLTLHFTLQRTHFKQRLEFSLFETTHLVLFFSQKEQRNISKLVCLIHNTSALRL
jgi:hypothetical protein